MLGPNKIGVKRKLGLRSLGAAYQNDNRCQIRRVVGQKPADPLNVGSVDITAPVDLGRTQGIKYCRKERSQWIDGRWSDAVLRGHDVPQRVEKRVPLRKTKEIVFKIEGALHGEARENYQRKTQLSIHYPTPTT